MKERRSMITRMFFILFTYCLLTPLGAPIYAAEKWCGSDLNGNDYVGDSGETTICLIGDNGTDQVCPIGEEVCLTDPLSCPTDYTLSGSQCNKSAQETISADIQILYTCPIGFTQNENTCTRAETTYISATLQTNYSCPAGFSRSGSICSHTQYSSSSAQILYNVCQSNGGGVTRMPNELLVLVCGGAGNNTTGYVICYFSGGCVANISLNASSSSSYSCPATYTLAGSQCFRSTSITISATESTYYSCPVDYTLSGSQCFKEVIETIPAVQSYSCPTNPSSACIQKDQQFVCSINPCVSLTDTPPEIVNEINGEMLIDNGEKNEAGACLDQIFIYNGRAQECRKSGVKTGFQNCCKGDATLTDSTGSISTLAQSVSTIKSLYGASTAAYSAYTSALANSATTATAQAAAGEAFTNSIIGGIDPTSIAISIAVYVVMDMLLTGCDQMDIETSMSSESGYCHYVGTYCKVKWKFIGCVQKAKSYCCFNSKLARIIHEQARPQLNNFGSNSWGTPENPNCIGFSPEEFQAIDFSKVDLTEYYDDLTRRAQSEIQQSMNNAMGDYLEKAL